MPVTIELQITESEKSALIAVLPLVSYINNPDPIKLSVFKHVADNALSALESDQFRFSAIELYVISLCVDAGITLCSGQTAGFFAAGTPILEWQRKLAPHYFSLRKLAPILGEFVDEKLR